MTLRRALEHSKNLVTARLLDGGIALRAGAEPARASANSPSRRSSTWNACRTTPSCSAPSRCGSWISPPSTPPSPTRARGRRPTRSRRSSRAAAPSTAASRRRRSRSASADRAAFYQMKTPAAGRAAARHGAVSCATRALRRRQDRHHGRGERRLVRRLHQRGHDRGLGRLRQRRRASAAPSAAARPGGKVALPIFEAIVQAAWRDHAPRTRAGAALAARSRRSSSPLPIDLRTGDRLEPTAPARRPSSSTSPQRTGSGELDDTQFSLVPRERGLRLPRPRSPDERARRRALRRGGWVRALRTDVYGRASARRSLQPLPYDPTRAATRPYAAAATPSRWWASNPAARRPRRVDPDYFWGDGTIY